MNEIIKLGAKLAHELIDLLASELVEKPKERKRNVRQKMPRDNSKRNSSRHANSD